MKEIKKIIKEVLEKTLKDKEDLYLDGVNSAMYKTYMRDEVYTYSIKFFKISLK